MRPAAPYLVRLRFHGGLDFFLKRAAEGTERTRRVNEPTSIKDLIESLGVPHPEVDRILIGGRSVGFDYVVREGCEVDVYPVRITPAYSAGESLQNRHVERFVADGHLGKLARNLRLLGIDVSYDSHSDDPQLLQVMQSENRALLTRDRRLLMHRIVVNGYCPRSSEAMTQTVEVVQRFELNNDLKPFSRCVECNGLLAPIDKSAVLDRLEPLTRIYYHEFRACAACGKIFWRGSHFAKLEGFVERLRAAVQK